MAGVPHNADSDGNPNVFNLERNDAKRLTKNPPHGGFFVFNLPQECPHEKALFLYLHAFPNKE